MNANAKRKRYCFASVVLALVGMATATGHAEESASYVLRPSFQADRTARYHLWTQQQIVQTIDFDTDKQTH